MHFVLRPVVDALRAMSLLEEWQLQETGHLGYEADGLGSSSDFRRSDTLDAREPGSPAASIEAPIFSLELVERNVSRHAKISAALRLPTQYSKPNRGGEATLGLIRTCNLDSLRSYSPGPEARSVYARLG